MARTNNLTNFLTDVASAIKTKKGDNTPIQASNFDTEIANLPSGGSGCLIDWNNIEDPDDFPDDFSIKGLNDGYEFIRYDLDTTDGDFSVDGNYSLQNLMYLPDLDTYGSFITNMKQAFTDSLNIVSIGNLDTSNVTNFYQAFYGCENLINVPILDFSSVQSRGNLEEVFYGNSKLSSRSIINIFKSFLTATNIPAADRDMQIYVYDLRGNIENLIGLMNSSQRGELNDVIYDLEDAGWTVF